MSSCGFNTFIFSWEMVMFFCWRSMAGNRIKRTAKVMRIMAMPYPLALPNHGAIQSIRCCSGKPTHL